MPGITSAETPAPKPQKLFRPIDRDEFRGLLIDSSVGLRFVVAARGSLVGSFQACCEEVWVFLVFLMACSDLRDYE